MDASLPSATDVHLLAAAIVGVLVVLAVVLVGRAAHARDLRVRRAVRALHDARLRDLGSAEVDATFEGLVAPLRRTSR